jgi:hypothetical protein
MYFGHHKFVDSFMDSRTTCLMLTSAEPCVPTRAHATVIEIRRNLSAP